MGMGFVRVWVCFLFVWACRAAPPPPKRAPAPSANPATGAPTGTSNHPPSLGVLGLYSCDGTLGTPARNSVIWQAHATLSGAKTTASEKSQRVFRYFPGTDLLAQNLPQLAHDVVAQICQDVAQKKITGAYFTGYSRGAIMALEVAKMAQKKCKAPIRWLGLVDAVETGIETWEKEGSKRTLPPGARGLHLFKKHNLPSEADKALVESVKSALPPQLAGALPSTSAEALVKTIFNTTVVDKGSGAFLETKATADTSHNSIGQNPKTLGALLETLKKEGI